MENVRWKTDFILCSSAISARKNRRFVSRRFKKITTELILVRMLYSSVNNVVNNGKCKMENGLYSAFISNICEKSRRFVSRRFKKIIAELILVRMLYSSVNTVVNIGKCKMENGLYSAHISDTCEKK